MPLDKDVRACFKSRWSGIDPKARSSLTMTGTQIQSKERSESLTRSKQMAISAVNNLMLRGLAPQLAFACVTWGPLIPHSDGNYYSYRTVVFEWKSPSSFVYTKITLILKLESGSPDSS